MLAIVSYFRIVQSIAASIVALMLAVTPSAASDHGSHGTVSSHGSSDSHGAHGASHEHGADGAHGTPYKSDWGIDADAAAAATKAKIRGVELGFYKVRSDYPVQAQKSMVRFVLQTSVPSEIYEETKALVDCNLHRLRDQVITVTRLAPLSVFDEPELTTFRRLIVVRLRRALPELGIDDVYISDFQLSVKSL